MSSEMLLKISPDGVLETPLIFYSDGTYIRAGSMTSWWMYDGVHLYIRHSEKAKWIALDKSSSSSDQRVANKVIDAIGENVEKMLLSEEE